MSKNKARKEHNRRGDGGVYLVVADKSPEFRVALDYAARLARSNRAHIGILSVIDRQDFQPWGEVEARMSYELRKQAEDLAWEVAGDIAEDLGMLPTFYLLEGSKIEAIEEVVAQDKRIRKFVLGGATGSHGPGPLVSYFTGKGLGRLRLPLTVVPGTLHTEDIQVIT
jgi:nucleotide-binding universal stress UspA family protein